MKRRILALFVALALVVGVAGSVVITTEEPASAHNESSWSYWYCSKHRSSTGMTVIHSKVYGLWPGQIGYYCREDFFGESFQYWVVAQPPGGQFSYMPWDRQKCWPSPGWLVVCEEP